MFLEWGAEGVTLRGWLYVPDGAGGPVPTVVMAHGLSAVKEMYLDDFAEAFAAGGLGALVFDNRPTRWPRRSCRLPTPGSGSARRARTGRRPGATRTLRSVELLMEYEPSAYLERISPTPLLMVVAAGDHLTPTDLALEAYQRAREPKKLVLLPGGHFDAYVKDFETASAVARDWFLEHLSASG
jgi:fermentation-respiration switch protein FrsA (DUF1100 family)